jgi:hypothetical protein
MKHVGLCIIENHVMILYSKNLRKKSLSFLVPPPYTTKTTPSQEYEEKTSDISEGTETPSALGDDSDSGLSSMLIYAGGGIVLLAIVGIVAFIIIRKRKQNNENMNVSPTNSVASSAISGADV